MKQNRKRMLAIIGLLVYLTIAALGDRVIYLVNRQARQEGNFMIVPWAESIAILVGGAGLVLLIWLILSKLSEGDLLLGLVFLGLSLFLTFYPEIYFSPLRLGIVDYLVGSHHSLGSFLNHTGGLVFALGLLLLIRRMGLPVRK